MTQGNGGAMLGSPNPDGDSAGASVGVSVGGNANITQGNGVRGGWLGVRRRGGS